MAFLSPALLLALLALPLLVLAYRSALARRARTAVVHPDLLVLAQAGSGARPWRRHLPAALYLAAIGIAVLTLARPTLPLPSVDDRAKVVLSVDISRSMRNADVQPSRFEAAKAAAKDFVRAVPDGIRVGLVAFCGYATEVVPPTGDRDRLLSAIDELYMIGGTAIGDGLLASLDSLEAGEDGWGDPSGRNSPGAEGREAERDPLTVVLLSDGRSMRGTDPLEAAAAARERGITVHTIGVGAVEGAQPDYGGAQPGEGFGWVGGRGFGSRFDEETLRSIAQTAGGQYHGVDSADRLREVYRDLGRLIGWRLEPSEATGIAGLLAAAVLALSLAVGSRARRVV